MNEHEEYRSIPHVISWALVVLLSGAVVTWCMFIMMMIDDRPRTWDFGALPDVPAESIYSTVPGVPAFDPQQPPQQMPKLPEAKEPRRTADAAPKETGT